MTPPPATPPPGTTRGTSPWVVVLAVAGGPTAWAAHLGLSYYLVPRACAAGTALPLHAVTVATALLALAAMAAAWRLLRRRDDRRGAFLATVGLLVGALFLAALLAGGLPVLFVDPCR